MLPRKRQHSCTADDKENDMAKYTVRDARNEESRQTAGQHLAAWTDDDVAYLRANFTTSAQMTAVAQHLGRTVEACREKYYKGTGAGQNRQGTRTPGQRAWDKGMTSFDHLDW